MNKTLTRSEFVSSSCRDGKPLSTQVSELDRPLLSCENRVPLLGRVIRRLNDSFLPILQTGSWQTDVLRLEDNNVSRVKTKKRKIINYNQQQRAK